MNWFRRYRRRKRITRLTDEMFDRYLARLGTVELIADGDLSRELRRMVTPADVAALAKTDALISGEHCDRITLDELQKALATVITIATTHVPEGGRAAYLAEVRRRLGKLGDEP